MKWVERIKGFVRTIFDIVLGGVFAAFFWAVMIGGNLFWLFQSFVLKSFWMVVAMIFLPPLTGPLGVWAFVFGTPNWLIEFTTDDESSGIPMLTEEELRDFANTYNEQLPKRLASDLFMINMSIRSGPTMAYTYTWDDGPALEAYLENPDLGNTAALRAGCSDPKGARMFLDQGISMQYIYYRPDGTFIADFDFDISDCPK